MTEALPKKRPRTEGCLLERDENIGGQVLVRGVGIFSYRTE
jgi:hypothetical protein